MKKASPSDPVECPCPCHKYPDNLYCLKCRSNYRDLLEGEQLGEVGLDKTRQEHFRDTTKQTDSNISFEESNPIDSLKNGVPWQEIILDWYDSIYEFGRDSSRGGVGIAKAMEGEKKNLVNFISQLLEERETKWRQTLEDMLDDGRPLGDVIKEKLAGLEREK